MTTEIQWLTTAPNPRVVCHTADAGQRGWRLHAVIGSGKDPLYTFEYKTSLCGLAPARGWGVDMFIDKPCERCYRKALYLRLEIDPAVTHEWNLMQTYESTKVSVTR